MTNDYMYSVCNLVFILQIIELSVDSKRNIIKEYLVIQDLGIEIHAFIK